MSKLDAKYFNSITPFAKQWILGDEMYEFLEAYPQFLSSKYNIINLGDLNYSFWENFWYTPNVLPDVDKSTNYARGFLSTNEYKLVNIASGGSLNNMEMSIDYNGYLQLKNTEAGWETYEDVQRDLDGIYLIYENNGYNTISLTSINYYKYESDNMVFWYSINPLNRVTKRTKCDRFTISDNNYTPVNKNGLASLNNMECSIDYNGYFQIRNDNCTDLESLLTALAGITISYEVWEKPINLGKSKRIKTVKSVWEK